MRYFRRFVDDHRYGRVTMLKEVLGPEATRPQYEGHLEMIPFEEISNVDPKPLGGSNGVVYRAEWRCPQKVHMRLAETKPVALKTMRLGGAAMKNFIDEVRHNAHANSTIIRFLMH